MLQAYAGYSTVLNKIIAAAREREAGEITPVSAEHSANLNDDDANHGGIGQLAQIPREITRHPIKDRVD